MGYVPDMEQALAILSKYNKEPFHIKHGETVSGILGYFAKKRDPENEGFWRVTGLLHDIDFEMYPEEHCVKGIELMKAEGIDESVISAALSHGYGLTQSPYPPRHIMEKVLFAVDELSGLIGAVILTRPSKSADDLEPPSVMKKFKDKRFAAGCSRDTILEGAKMLDTPLEELIKETILAIRCM